MDIVPVGAGRIEEAAETLARAMLDEPLGRWLLPDPVEFLEVHQQLFAKTMMRALEEGRIDACGDPFVGAAVWFVRPSIDEDPPRPTSDMAPLVPKHAAARVDEVSRLLRLMRREARPDHHVYLDGIGVLPGHRRRGYATGLLQAGFDWADALALPCSLETLDPHNVAYYRHLGFEVVAAEPLVGSGLTVTSMRRPPP